MSIRFSCENCQKPVKAPDEAAGKKVRCPECQAVVRAPGSKTSKSRNTAPGDSDEEPPLERLPPAPKRLSRANHAKSGNAHRPRPPLAQRFKDIPGLFRENPVLWTRLGAIAGPVAIAAFFVHILLPAMSPAYDEPRLGRRYPLFEILGTLEHFYGWKAIAAWHVCFALVWLGIFGYLLIQLLNVPEGPDAPSD